ncbi:PQQ-dependent sugar dehydrogenase [Paracoccus sp. S-4012]|uniref:PQQ-dependent sugar dehydrogenase n=1 Tax=Paracoccus sp. S-4012 TaxID=2665648 RepID=UPI0012B0826F|nr:PQQ-dependent sugar dehydrogenase [Paracoccus sp. S-4012]MRX49789.1 PQQ-dependent sugar dehydrogenase [Paracoccus sp. S-4012]
MFRTLLASAAAAALAGPALGQDFNAAPPNVPENEPAFEGQTRAPVMADDIPLETTAVVEGLDHPWGMDLLPSGEWIVTERAGNLRLVAEDGTLSEPITGLPPMYVKEQGGLLDVLAAPDFAESRRLFLSYAAPEATTLGADERTDQGPEQTVVITATLSEDGTALENVQEIFRQQPAWATGKHFGSRLVLDDGGRLLITLGERSDMEPRMTAQEDDNHLGKIIRISPTGEPAGAGIEGWMPEVHSKGHRNIQAATLDDQGRLWVVDMGPQGGDELNLAQEGLNYGWPIITYGEEYSGEPIGEGITAQEGLEQPVYYWDPVIAPSGMVVYEGEMFPEWQGDFLIGGLQAQAVVRLDMQDDRVAGEARHLQGIGRVRDVAVAPDGALMLLIDADNGSMIRVSRGE